MPAALSVGVSRYFAAGAPAGGVAVVFVFGLAGAVGRAAAAPVVVPGSVLAFGVTSRMPGGAAGGWVCAVWFAGVVPAWFTLVEFKP